MVTTFPWKSKTTFICLKEKFGPTTLTGDQFIGTYSIGICIHIYTYVCMTCSNEMSCMSANLISRKHCINMQQWFPTILTAKYTSISFLLIGNAYFSFILLFSTFCSLFTNTNILSMNFVKTEPKNCTCSSHILLSFPQHMADIFGTMGKPRMPSFGFL